MMLTRLAKTRCLVTPLYSSKVRLLWSHARKTETAERLRVQNPMLLNQRGLALFKKWNHDPTKDGLVSGEQLIFSNNNKWYLHSAYVSLAFCCVYMTFATGLTYYNYFNGHLPANINPDHPLVYVTLGYPFALGLLCGARKLVTMTLFRIYYHAPTNTFTGINFSWLMNKTKLVFRPEHVEIFESNSYLREMKGNVMIKEVPYYLPLKDFKHPVYYNIMVGLVKPEELKQENVYR